MGPRGRPAPGDSSYDLIVNCRHWNRLPSNGLEAGGSSLRGTIPDRLEERHLAPSAPVLQGPTFSWHLRWTAYIRFVKHHGEKSTGCRRSHGNHTASDSDCVSFSSSLNNAREMERSRPDINYGGTVLMVFVQNPFYVPPKRVSTETALGLPERPLR